MDCHDYTEMKKEQLRTILLERNWTGLERFWSEEKSAQRLLLQLMFDKDALIKWRSIEALGVICITKFNEDPEWVKGIIRHFVWGMNDESGNLIWHAPEAMSEILVRIPGLISEFAPILASQMETEPFPAGVHYALARISFVDAKVLSYLQDYLQDSLDIDDPTTAVSAYICLKNMGFRTWEDKPYKLFTNMESMTLYNFYTGELDRQTVKDCIRLSETEIRRYFICGDAVQIMTSKPDDNNGNRFHQ